MGDKSIAVHKLEQAVDMVTGLSDEEGAEDKNTGNNSSIGTVKFSPLQVRDFKKLFNLFDRDKNFSLDEREMAKLFRALGQNPTSQELKKIIQEADVNGNGQLEREEYIDMLKSHMQSRPEVEKELSDAFTWFDLNKDGKLTRKELTTALRSCGEPLTTEETDELMDQMDANRDGIIDIKEFTAFLCSGFPDLEPIDVGQEIKQ